MLQREVMTTLIVMAVAALILGRFIAAYRRVQEANARKWLEREFGMSWAGVSRKEVMDLVRSLT